MSFGVDYSQASGNSGGIVPEGEYEVIIKSAIEDATPRGAMFINVPLIIRNDIEQPYKNAYIWHKIWQLKQPSDADKACGGYSSKGIQNLSKAAGLENGKKYPDLQAWGDDLKGKLIRVKVKHEEFNNETQVRVQYVNETKHPECKHVFKSAAGQPAAVPPEMTNDNFYPLNEDDDDLPF